MIELVLSLVLQTAASPVPATPVGSQPSASWPQPAAQLDPYGNPVMPSGATATPQLNPQSGLLGQQAQGGLGLQGWLGGVQAPTQPLGSASSASVVSVPRPIQQLARGTGSPVRVRVGSLAAVRGQEQNVIHGVGLISGLTGTGDSGDASRRALRELMLTQNINLDLGQVNSSNIAVVWVEAVLPPGVKPGRLVDARVSSIYDAKSLFGGQLIWSELTDPTGQAVFATAAGPITLGGFSAEGEGASAVRNHLTVGRIPQGCKVERAVPTEMISEQGYLYLDLNANNGSFGNTVRIAEAINTLFPGHALPVDAMTVRVYVPETERATPVAFVSALLSISLEPEASARIVVNERTGAIMLGEEVRIGRGAISKGNLTVTIAETPQVSQPGPLSNGTTEVLPRTSLLIEEEQANLAIVNGTANLQEVVEVLNILGVSPRDKIDVLQSMAQAGMLYGELIVQ